MFGSSRFQGVPATRIFPNLLDGGRCRDRRADAADLPPEHEHHLAGVDRRRRARSHRLRAGRRLAPALTVPDRGGRAARAADPLQPQAPRGGARHRLPLLPHLGGGVLVRGHPAHRDVHELPPRDLEGQPDARGGARELSQRPAARVDPRPRPPRLRLLRSQHPRRQGRGLRQLSRARRRHAAHLAGGDAADGLVPRLPPPSRALRAPARARLRHGLAAAGRSGGERPRAGQGVRDHGPDAPDELRHVSPMSEPGRTWWRSLEELADPAALEALLARQYPSQAAAWLDPFRRREFLKLMAASLALGGLTACTSQPPEKIVPYVKAPEDVVPGKPLFFATAVAHPGGLGTGVLVESHMGRPTKVEGNPEHPASLGATDAEVILALDADFLGCGPAHLRYVRDFAARRRPGAPEMNRLYVLESTLTTTGAKADHRLALAARDVESAARAVAARLGTGVPRREAPALSFVEPLVRDLARHRGRSAVIPGEHQAPAVHALAHAMNQALGNVGKTVVHTAPVEARPEDQLASLRALVQDMEAGRVELLLVLGGNPVFTAPADVPFAAALAQVPLSVHLGLYHDETAALCHWHVPEAHPLEAWSDVRAFDGTVTIVQPLIAPLYGGKSAHELLAALGEPPDRSGYDLVRQHWQARRHGGDFEQAWRRWLHDGVVPGTALAPVAVVAAKAIPQSPAAGGGLELVFRPDPTIHDGRHANNAWLQELPKPITHLTWDNVALVSPATAERLAVKSEDVVELTYRKRTVRAPVWVMPGHPDESVTVHLGGGRTRAGRVGTGTGVDAYALRFADGLCFTAGLEVRPTGERHPLAATQHHQRMEGRDIVRATTLERYLHEKPERPELEATLYPLVPYPGHRWGMAIDLSACVGCNACVVACQAENNIPVVGRDQA